MFQFFVFWLAALLSVSGSQAQLQVLDDSGHNLILERPANRIISLAPSLTELLYAAGAGSKIVGVVEFSDYPPEASEIAIVGRHDLLDLERIVSLRPDLIVAWQTGNPVGSIRQLRGLGLEVYIAEPKSLASVAEQLTRLGVLAGTTPIASQASSDFLLTLNHLQGRYSDAEPVDVFYQVWDTPLITAGGNELLNDIITVCGGKNVFADISTMAPKVNREAVLARNPEVIIASGMDRARPEWLDDWRRWPTLQAVQKSQLFYIAPDLLQRHTPRALEGATLLCEQLAGARENRGR